MVPWKPEKVKTRYPLDLNGALETRKSENQVPIRSEWCSGNREKRNPGTHTIRKEAYIKAEGIKVLSVVQLGNRSVVLRRLVSNKGLLHRENHPRRAFLNQKNRIKHPALKDYHLLFFFCSFFSK